MEALIEFVTDNPLYAVGTALLLILLIVALVKKMLKVAIIAVALNVGYTYYLHDMAQDAYAKAEAKAEDIKDKTEDLIDAAGNIIDR